MSFLPGVLWLQAAEQPVPFLASPIPMMVAIFLIFYFLMIRPQQKRQKTHDAMLKAIEKGDEVVTTGGLHGKVTGVADDVLTVEIAVIKGERVRVKVARNKVESTQKSDASKSKGDASKSKGDAS